MAASETGTGIVGRERRTFGAWLKREIGRREMTQSDFARATGVSTAVVSQWVQNKRVPTTESLERIADGLRLPIEDVLAAAGHAVTPAQGPELRRLVGVLTRAQHLLDPNRVAALEAIIRTWEDPNHNTSGRG